VLYVNRITRSKCWRHPSAVNMKGDRFSRRAGTGRPICTASHSRKSWSWCPPNSLKYHHHHHHLPLWIRSFDLLGIDALPSFPRASTISSSSRFVFEGVFRESGVVHSFKIVDPVLCLDLTSCIPESSSSFLRTSLLILSSLKYHVGLFH